jgi:purine-nucleoside phosphorylase
VVGKFGDLQLAVAAGYGAALAGDFTHICCTLGARIVLVTGYFGALQPGIGYGDVLVPTRARPLDSVAPHYLEDAETQTHASEDVVHWLVDRCGGDDIPHHLGAVVSAPSIMTETDDHFKEWHQQGYYGVDLEVGVAFAVAQHYGARCGAMLVQSDSPIEGTYIFTRRSDDEREVLRSRIFHIGRIALEAASKFARERTD